VLPLALVLGQPQVVLRQWSARLEPQVRVDALQVP
jgi:hypothetical protein